MHFWRSPNTHNFPSSSSSLSSLSRSFTILSSFFLFPTHSRVIVQFNDPTKNKKFHYIYWNVFVCLKFLEKSLSSSSSLLSKKKNLKDTEFQVFLYSFISLMLRSKKKLGGRGLFEFGQEMTTKTKKKKKIF